MRKQPTAPRSRKHQRASAAQQAGLIAQGKSPSRSARGTCALDNRSHRTDRGSPAAAVYAGSTRPGRPAAAAGCSRLLGGDSRRMMKVMMTRADAVLAEALRLDAKARADIAAELLASLDGPADPDAEAAWQAEIQRRVAAIESGTAELEPWEDVKRRIEKDILGR